MSHPESDGASEMLEGGLRAVSTGALRMVETMQRRQQWATRHQTDQLKHHTRRVEQQQRALNAVDDLVRGGPRTPNYATPTAGAQTSAPTVPSALQLFPHFAPEVAEAAMNDLVVHGDLSSYLQAHRSATQQARRTGRTPTLPKCTAARLIFSPTPATKKPQPTTTGPKAASFTPCGTTSLPTT